MNGASGASWFETALRAPPRHEGQGLLRIRLHTSVRHTKKTPPGGDAGRGLLSGRNSRTSACAAPGRSFRLLRSIDHLNDATGTRLDQDRLAVHDRVAIRRHAERLRHVVIGHAGFRQHAADHDAIGNREGRNALADDVFARLVSVNSTSRVVIVDSGLVITLNQSVLQAVLTV
jgi:hypothetical protein